MKAVFLINRHEFREQELLKQMEFICNVLLEIGFPEEEVQLCFSDDNTDIQNRINLRDLCSKYNLSIVDNKSGHIKIYVDTDLIAEWYKPSYIYKEDLSAIDPKDRLYAEMHTKFWVFEKD